MSVQSLSGYEFEIRVADEIEDVDEPNMQLETVRRDGVKVAVNDCECDDARIEHGLLDGRKRMARKRSRDFVAVVDMMNFVERARVKQAMGKVEPNLKSDEGEAAEK